MSAHLKLVPKPPESKPVCRTPPAGLLVDNVAVILPWHAVSALDAGQAEFVAAAMGRDSRLRGEFAAVQEECRATRQLAEARGTPSPRPLAALLRAIDNGG